MYVFVWLKMFGQHGNPICKYYVMSLEKLLTEADLRETPSLIFLNISSRSHSFDFVSVISIG